MIFAFLYLSYFRVSIILPSKYIRTRLVNIQLANIFRKLCFCLVGKYIYGSCMHSLVLSGHFRGSIFKGKISFTIYFYADIVMLQLHEKVIFILFDTIYCMMCKFYTVVIDSPQLIVDYQLCCCIGERYIISISGC